MHAGYHYHAGNGRAPLGDPPPGGGGLLAITSMVDSVQGMRFLTRAFWAALGLPSPPAAKEYNPDFQPGTVVFLLDP